MPVTNKTSAYRPQRTEITRELISLRWLNFIKNLSVPAIVNQNTRNIANIFMAIVNSLPLPFSFPDRKREQSKIEVMVITELKRNGKVSRNKASTKTILKTAKPSRVRERVLRTFSSLLRERMAVASMAHAQVDQLDFKKMGIAIVRKRTARVV
ncbi:MAG: hypothetical protein P8Z50_08105 [candidate division WOR-3 bacterium]